MELEPPPKPPVSQLSGPDMQLLNMIMDLTSAVSRLSDAVLLLSVSATPELRADILAAKNDVSGKVRVVFSNIREFLGNHG